MRVPSTVCALACRMNSAMAVGRATPLAHSDDRVAYHTLKHAFLHVVAQVRVQFHKRAQRERVGSGAAREHQPTTVLQTMQQLIRGMFGHGWLHIRSQLECLR